jgi:hypothetical protein
MLAFVRGHQMVPLSWRYHRIGGAANPVHWIGIRVMLQMPDVSLLCRPEVFMDQQILAMLLAMLCKVLDFTAKPKTTAKVTAHTQFILRGVHPLPHLMPAVRNMARSAAPMCPVTQSVFLPMKAGTVVDCCKRLCSAMCTVTQSSYGPCAAATSQWDLVHGTTAGDALEHLRATHAGVVKVIRL